MTSGFNIATNISTDSEFNAMTALTHEEVKTLLNALEIKNKREIFNEMIENYDGYKFNREDDELVFNPTLTMYYLNNIERKGIQPIDYLDKNILSSYEQIKNIISLGDYKEIMKDIYDNDKIASELVVNFDVYNNFNKNEIVSLLYYFGYLTIKESLTSLNYIFTIPNKVIRRVYGDYYINILNEYNINTVSDMETTAVNEIMNNGKIDKLCEYISYLLKNADNRLYINFTEKDLQIMIYAILSRYLEMNVSLEYQSNDNYIDIMIFKNKSTKYNIMIELKYLKKREGRLYNKKEKEAVSQINNYLEGVNLDKDTLKKYTVVFIGSDYKLKELK